ncbi:polymer-forming cytoskeletal protein [Halorubrum rubrum]|uniref:Polymer-forming cytoskeletal protein n=1 Tax=Halorubrum rubrum TaxID=1126240 RepID=A0ABD5R1T6_9EURY|nr:polymer-forming cytoskeletal protein [Halorubrum rubrum]
MVPPLGGYGRRIVVTLLIVGLLVPLATGGAAAQSIEGASGSIVVDEGETVDGIESVAGTVVVRGTVAGDLSGAAGSIRIAETGRVEGNVDAAAGTLVVDGTVEGDVRTGTGSFELTDTGRVDGSIDVGAGSIVVDGTVGGDVRAAGDSVAIGPNAEVGGEFRYDAEEFTRSPDASVAGGVVEDASLRGDAGVGFGMDVAPSWFGTAYAFAANLVLGAVLLLAFPRFSRDVAARVEADPLASGGIGLLTLVAVPLALLLMTITIVGIPLALLGIAGYVAAVWIAAVYGRYAVGMWVTRRLGAENRWIALVGGLLGFAILGAIPLVGGVVELLALLLGLGALAFGLRDRYRRGRRTTDGTNRSDLT